MIERTKTAFHFTYKYLRTCARAKNPIKATDYVFIISSRKCQKKTNSGLLMQLQFPKILPFHSETLFVIRK
jgi:hypothetical protein